jgi:hypothetical protein
MTGLAVNVEKTKYMLMSPDQHGGQNHNAQRAKIPFGRVQQSLYLGTTLRNQNCIHREIKSRMKSGLYLLLFGAESFVFKLAVQEHKD